MIILFPFAPFISEEIYSKLPNSKKSIYEEEYPSESNFAYRKEDIQLAKSLNDAIKMVRNHKSELSMAPNAPVELGFFGKEEDFAKVKNYLSRFSFASDIVLLENKNDDLSYFASFALEIKEEETVEAKQRRAKRIEFLNNEIARSEKMLSNPNFVSKAKPEKIALEKEKYEKYKEELAKYMK